MNSITTKFIQFLGYLIIITSISYSNYFSENKILNLPTARWFSLKFKSENWSDIIDLKPISYLNNLKSGV